MKIEKLKLVGPPEPGSIKRHVFELKFGSMVEVPASFGWAEHWRCDGVTSRNAVVFSALFYQPRGVVTIDYYPSTPLLLMAVKIPAVIPPEYRLNKILMRFGGQQSEAKAILDLKEVEVPG